MTLDLYVHTEQEWMVIRSPQCALAVGTTEYSKLKQCALEGLRAFFIAPDQLEFRWHFCIGVVTCTPEAPRCSCSAPLDVGLEWSPVGLTARILDRPVILAQLSSVAGDLRAYLLQWLREKGPEHEAVSLRVFT